MKQSVTLLLVLFIGSLCRAQPAASYLSDTTRAVDLGEVVVTGQFKPRSLQQSVYQVKVITADAIQRRGATQLQDVLRNELNLRFSQDVATGGSSINLLGLRGQNVKLLIDGLPLVGRQGVNNEINLNQIDIHSIERIEIAEGPMAVVYGADALAGVINIITKKATQAGWQVTARLHEETISDEYGINRGIHNQQVGVNWRKGKWDAGGSLSHNYFGGWRDTTVGRELAWHRRDQRMTGAFAGYRSGRLSVRYRVDGLDEIITNPGNFLPFADPASGDTLAYDQQYLSQRVMQQLQASWFVNNRFSIETQSVYTDYSRQVFSTTLNKNNGDVRLQLADGAQSHIRFTGLTHRTTALYRLSNAVSVQSGWEINRESGQGERLKAGNNTVADYAFFMSAEIGLLKNLQVRPGVRVSKNSIYPAPPLIPSLNGKWVINPATDLRFSYARGFRAPSLRELYFSFFDVNHQVVGNPDLKAETSNSFTASLNWKNKSTAVVPVTLVLSGFYNSIRNMIDYLFTPGTDTARIANLFNARTAGSTLVVSAQRDRWQASLGSGVTGFYNDYSVSDNKLPALQWSAELTSQFSYRFPKAGLVIQSIYKLTGHRPYFTKDLSGEIIPGYTKAFHWADVTISKKMGTQWLLQTGLRNLFNVGNVQSAVVRSGVHTPSGITAMGSGRSGFVSLQFNWNKK